MSTSIETFFANTERHVAEVAAAVVSGEPQSLGIASASLRQATLTLSDAVQRLSPAQQRDPRVSARVRKMAAALALHRESLIRRTVLVERALNNLVPATRDAAYAQGPGAYGRLGRQSGTFGRLSA